jgi:hypothetical protein
MKKIKVLFILLLLAPGFLRSQVFTPVKTDFSGVINPVMSWVISSDTNAVSYAFLAGENYANNQHYLIARFDKNVDHKRYFVNVSAPFPVLYRGDAAAADYNKDGRIDLVMTGLNSQGFPQMDSEVTDRVVILKFWDLSKANMTDPWRGVIMTMTVIWTFSSPGS